MNLTPIETHDGILVKRDDTYEVAGQFGGKVRTCLYLGRKAQAERATGLITAGSRHSPQVAIVSTVAQTLGLRCRVHVPAGDSTPEIVWAEERGAEVVRHRPGYNSVIVARAREDAAVSPGWQEIPFGMETPAAADMTATQVPNVLEAAPRRVVVPVGSGMSLAGILTGFERDPRARNLADLPPVIGVQVGADPTERLDRYAPPWWRAMADIHKSGYSYGQRPDVTTLGTLDLDPVYEAKCLPFLRPGDLLWVVGRRG